MCLKPSRSDFSHRILKSSLSMLHRCHFFKSISIVVLWSQEDALNFFHLGCVGSFLTFFPFQFKSLCCSQKSAWDNPAPEVLTDFQIQHQKTRIQSGAWINPRYQHENDRQSHSPSRNFIRDAFIRLSWGANPFLPLDQFFHYIRLGTRRWTQQFLPLNPSFSTFFRWRGQGGMRVGNASLIPTYESDVLKKTSDFHALSPALQAPHSGRKKKCKPRCEKKTSLREGLSTSMQSMERLWFAILAVLPRDDRRW